MVVVLKFSQRKEVSSVILSFVDEDAKIPFQLLVDPFCLAVSLGVICSCGSQFDTKHLVELPGELGYKLRSRLIQPSDAAHDASRHSGR